MRDSKKKEPEGKKEKPSDDFISVARRLEADEDKERFEAALGKIARAKLPTGSHGKRQKD